MNINHQQTQQSDRRQENGSSGLAGCSAVHRTYAESLQGVPTDEDTYTCVPKKNYAVQPTILLERNIHINHAIHMRPV